jgi:small nuclear ribonucleoprotein (snRNP)-like protein
MFKKLALILIISIIFCQVFGIFNQAAAQAKDRLEKTESFWVRSWNWLKEHTFVFSISVVTFITVFSTVMAMLKKDKILKSLSGHLVTIELKGEQPGNDGERYRGRLRVESEGLEVVEEKANKSREKLSYLLRKDEMSKIHAVVRYHDFLTDREKEEREKEVDKVYHPSIGMRLRRKIRNIVNEMRRVATEAFTLVFGKVREQFGKYGQELEKTGAEAVSYATEATYDALIDRLIGTRVVVHVKDNLEYVGVLKDYTKDFIELLNVNYKNSWQTTIKREEGSKHERGLTFRKEGNDIVIKSRSPFKLTLKHMYWKGDRADAKREHINKTIEPFGELRFNLMPPTLDIVVNPFEKLQLPTNYHYQEYKTISLRFETVRVTDIVMLKDYGLVRHRTEKYEARILDFGALADALLTDKSGNLVLEGNPEGTPLSIHNGYLTNLPMERMDVVAVDSQINRRWTVDSSFITLDKKLRPVSNYYLFGFIPFIKANKIISLFALLQMIHSKDESKKSPLLPFIYLTICNANSRNRKAYKNHVLIKKKKNRILGFIPRPTQV